MKSLTHYIQEKLVIKKSKYNYFPQTKKELRDIIEKRIKKEGNEVDLNDICTSNITDMENMFKYCTMPKKFSLGKQISHF